MDTGHLSNSSRRAVGLGEPQSLVSSSNSSSIETKMFNSNGNVVIRRKSSSAHSGAGLNAPSSTSPIRRKSIVNPGGSGALFTNGSDPSSGDKKTVVGHRMPAIQKAGVVSSSMSSTGSVSGRDSLRSSISLSTSSMPVSPTSSAGSPSAAAAAAAAAGSAIVAGGSNNHENERHCCTDVNASYAAGKGGKLVSSILTVGSSPDSTKNNSPEGAVFQNRSTISTLNSAGNAAEVPNYYIVASPGSDAPSAVISTPPPSTAAHLGGGSVSGSSSLHASRLASPMPTLPFTGALGEGPLSSSPSLINGGNYHAPASYLGTSAGANLNASVNSSAGARQGTPPPANRGVMVYNNLSSRKAGGREHSVRFLLPLSALESAGVGGGGKGSGDRSGKDSGSYQARRAINEKGEGMALHVLQQRLRSGNMNDDAIRLRNSKYVLDLANQVLRQSPSSYTPGSASARTSPGNTNVVSNIVGVSPVSSANTSRTSPASLNDTRWLLSPTISNLGGAPEAEEATLSTQEIMRSVRQPPPKPILRRTNYDPVAVNAAAEVEVGEEISEYDEEQIRLYLKAFAKSVKQGSERAAGAAEAQPKQQGWMSLFNKPPSKGSTTGGSSRTRRHSSSSRAGRHAVMQPNQWGVAILVAVLLFFFLLFVL